MASDPYNIHSQVELVSLPGEPLDAHTSPSRTCPSPTYYRRIEAHPREPPPVQQILTPQARERTSTISGNYDGKLISEASSQRYSNSQDHFPGSSAPGEDDDRVEYPPMPEDAKLGYISTGSLIVSNMVGTGVFAKAPRVLANSGGRGVSLLLWVAGGVTTFMGLCIYIELGIAFPFNGAEIVYTDEAYPKPKFLVVTLISMLTILLKNNAANTLQFAKLMLQVFEPNQEPDPRLQKFIGWLTLTAVCLLHVFSRKLGVALNNFLALYKTLLMVFIVVVGFAAMAGVRGKNVHYGSPKYGLENFEGAMKIEKRSMSQYASAILGVLWAYYGWDNANYVLAEVKRPPRHESRVFKRASLASLGLVTVLYILCNVSYYAVLADEELGVDGDLVAIRFFRKVFGDGWFTQRGLNVAFALSILGNFISYTYGVARVKQEIAKLKILPFSKYWAKQSHYDTPVGALTLHWIFASILLLFTPNNHGDDDVYNFITDLFTYAQNWIYIMVAVAVFSLKYHPKFRHSWVSKFLPWPVLAALAVGTVLYNVFIVVLTWIPPPKELRSPKISSYVTPGTVLGVLVFGLGYWFCYSQILPLLGWHVDYRPDELVDGSRIVSFRVYKDGFAERLSDWLDKNTPWLRRKKPSTNRKVARKNTQAGTYNRYRS